MWVNLVPSLVRVAWLKDTPIKAYPSRFDADTWTIIRTFNHFFYLKNLTPTWFPGSAKKNPTEAG